MIWLILAGWLFCGFVAACFEFAYFQRTFQVTRKERYYNDATHSIIMGIGGPVALEIVHHHKGFLIPYTKKSKREAGLL